MLNFNQYIMEQIGSICTCGNFNINGVGKTINVIPVYYQEKNIKRAGR